MKEGLVSPLHPPQYDLNPDNIIDTTAVPLGNPEEIVPTQVEEVGPEGVRNEKISLELEERIEEAKSEGEEVMIEGEDALKPEPELKAELDAEIKREEILEVEKETEVKKEQVNLPLVEAQEIKEVPGEVKRIEPAQEDQKQEDAKQEMADNLGYLVQICAGKQHILHLTEDGHVYSYGSGIYGVCGQGGAACCFQHQILKSLSDRKVMQIACGEYHSLALTQALNIYSWGRGFEGQLGIGAKGRAEIASRPTFIPFFDKFKVKCIAAGSYYSLAVSEQGELFGWGEARLGQLGCGKQSLVFTPQRIPVKEDIDDVMRKTHSTVNLKEGTPKNGDPMQLDARIRKVAAGFGHTAAITEDGQLYMWGLNVFGQLGIGEKRNIKRKPVRVEKDIANGWLPRVKDVACGYNFTFMIDSKLV